MSCLGVEIDGGAVREAIKAGLHGVVEGDLSTWNWRTKSVDVVRFWHSLEHVPSPRAHYERPAPFSAMRAAIVEFRTSAHS